MTHTSVLREFLQPRALSPREVLPREPIRPKSTDFEKTAEMADDDGPVTLMSSEGESFEIKKRWLCEYASSTCTGDVSADIVSSEPADPCAHLPVPVFANQQQQI